MDVDIPVPSAEDFVDDVNEDGVDSLPTNNEVPNDQPEAPEDENLEGDEGKEDQEEKDVPFHKHPRWIERNQEIKNLKENNQQLIARLEKLENSKPTEKAEPKPLSETQRAELKSLYQTMPKHEFKKDYATWDEAYEDMRDYLVQDIIQLQSIFNDRAQQSQMSQQEAAAQDKRQFAEQMVEIEDSMEPDEFQDFRKFVSEELGKNKDENFDSRRFLNKMHIEFLKTAKSKQPAKPSFNKSAVKKVGGKGRPTVGGSKGPDYNYIQNHSMAEIAQDMLGGN